jgi:hypothetical protein
MNFKRLLNTQTGVIFISILLGLGLASFFRNSCEGKKCIDFNGPLISEIDGKTYKYGEYCYKYKLSAATCDPIKKTVDLALKKNIDLEV